MAVNEVSIHMNVGDGDTSYTNNSAPQKEGISKSSNVLNEALEDMIKDMITDNGFPKCFKIADLGCSSGPNALLVISLIIDKLEHLSRENNGSHSLLEYEVFLSDLYGNDFNNLFKLLPNFYDKLNNKINNNQNSRKCFVSGLPGSFYGRLFPSNTLHFVHSSYSLHWLSQVPEGLESNKENIHIAKASPPVVLEAYKKQHRKDFFTFLNSRGEEMVKGGRMVLTLAGGSLEGPSVEDEECVQFTLLANSLVDLVNEGVIKEADLHSFNLPIYAPRKNEVVEIVHNEGSFNLEKIEEFAVPWDAQIERGSTDEYNIGELASKMVRAMSEPILAAHFGSSIMDVVYEKFGKKMGELQSSQNAQPLPSLVISLTKK